MENIKAKERFEDLLGKLGLPVPESKEDILMYAATIAAFGEIAGEIDTKEESTEVLEGLAGLYSNELEELSESRKNLYENRIVLREGMAKRMFQALLSEPKIAGLLLTVLLGVGFGVAEVCLGNKDYEQFDQCTDAICQTYENENTGYDRKNGGWSWYRPGGGVYHFKDSNWKGQQKAIKNWHNNDHKTIEDYDTNGILPGGEKDLKQYIMDHAKKGYHEVPNLTETFEKIYRKHNRV